MDSLITLTSGGDTLFGNDSDFSTAFYIGNNPVQWYAIISIIGYIVAICVYLLSIWKRYKVSVDVGFYYIFVAIPMILLGARLWSAMIGDLQWDQFFSRSGGLAIQGGVIGGIIGAIIYFPIILHFPKYHKRVVEDGHVYIQRPSLWIYADAIIPTILLGQAIGRWGNFMNGELFGQPVSPEDLAWLKAMMPGVYDHMYNVAGTQIPIGIENGTTIYAPAGTYFQPLFLYESFLNIVAFLIIYALLAEIKQIKVGVISGLYFVSYGIIRFGMESLRNSSFTFKGTYILNGILLAAGVVIVIYCQWFAIKLRKYYIWNWVKAHFNYIYRTHLFNSKIKTMKKNGVKASSINEYEKNNKPNKQNWGYAQPVSFIREHSDLTYYAGR